MNTKNECRPGANGAAFEQTPASVGRGEGEDRADGHGGQVVIDFADAVADAAVADDLGTGTEVRAIADIKVGPRHRRDLGDIDGLAESIADPDIGLLQPIIIDRDDNLCKGARRLAACKTLGWSHIPVRVVGARP